MTRKTTDLRCEEGSDRTDFVGMLRGAGLLLAGCAAAVLLFSVAGCSATDTDEPSIASTAEVLEENASEKSVEYASFEEVAAAFDASALNLEYSKRDMDASFDESSATKITLSGDSASVSGSGAVAEGSTVTISTAGTYIVSGNLADGSIAVTTSEDDKVQIVLNGVKIASSSGPAIDIQSADKCFITLAEGTQNSLSDGSAFTSEDANACIYATCDLTINGSGSLDVSGNYRHGVFSKDDLVVYGGSINVSAVEDGLNGKGGQAGEAPSDLGHAPDVQGHMERGGQAPGGQGGAPGASDSNCLIQINGGKVVLDSQGDGVDSNGNVEINGGTLLVNGPSGDGDGAFDYDGEATISGGTVLMAGVVGMAQSFTSGTQAFVLVQASGSAGNVIEATDADGNVIATLTATRAFGCVLVSGAGVSDGDTITVSVDGAATMATASTTGTSGIAAGGMGGGPATGNRPEGQGGPV